MKKIHMYTLHNFNDISYFCATFNINGEPVEPVREVSPDVGHDEVVGEQVGALGRRPHLLHALAHEALDLGLIIIKRVTRRS